MDNWFHWWSFIFYLANSERGNYKGKKSGYCLDVDSSRYLILSKCDKVNVKFKYGGYYSTNIYVYYKDKNGNYYESDNCIDYSYEYPKVRECKNAKNGYGSFGWDKIPLKTF